MAFENIDLQRMQPMQHIHVPAIGGLDSISPKTQVQPGTLYECSNYEVDLESGYKLSDGIALYTNRGFTVPAKFISSVISLGDTTASLDDFIAGGIYKVQDTDGNGLGEVRLLAITDEVTSGDIAIKVFNYEVVSTESSSIKGKLSPEASDEVNVFLGDPDSTDFVRLDTTPQTNLTASKYLERYKEVAGQLSTGTSSPPGQGAITGLFFFDDDLYAARTNAAGTGSKLYKSPDLSQITSDPEWETVDMGHEVEFKEGKNKPLTFYDRQFLDEQPTPADPITDVAAKTFSTQATVRSATQGTVFGDAWESVDSIIGDNNDDDTLAATALGNTFSIPLGWQFTELLQLRGFASDSNIDPNAKIVGFTVDVRYRVKIRQLAPISGSDPKGAFVTAKLLNTDGSDNKAPHPFTEFAPDGSVLSLTKSGNIWDSDWVTETLGGAADTWGANDLSISNIVSENFGVELEFGANMTVSGGTLRPRRDVFVSSVKLTVTFDNGDESLFFWDGSSDVAEGDLVNIGLTESNFVFNGAKGYLSLYNVDNPSNVVEDLEIRTAGGGSGTLVGKTAAAMTENMLPTATEMADNSSKMVTKTSNFFLDPDKIAVYGATGAGPAFHYNGTHFWFIHTPVPEGKDRPRYVAKHQNHLVLSFDRGAILVSRVEDANAFSGLLGASSHEFSGRRITGLLNLSGNALAVFTTDTVEALLGTSLNNFTTQTIANSGALDYTVVDVGQPLFTDFRGVSNLQASSNYGDFNFGRVSQLISNDIQKRIQLKQDIIAIDSEVNFALPVKNKNQYRLFFKNGEIFTMSLFDAGQPLPMFTRQEFIPVEQEEGP